MDAGSTTPDQASAYPPEPRADKPKRPSLDDRTLSLQSASGKRVHPRIGLPIRVEIAGETYRASDWSLGGLRLQSPNLALTVGEVRQARLLFTLPGFTATLEATLKVVWRSDAECGIRYIDISTDTARVISELVDLYATGRLRSMGGLAGGGTTPPPETKDDGAWLDTALELWHRFRTAALLALCCGLLLLLALYVIASRLTIYSDYAAVAGPAAMLRAPQAGILHGAPLAVGSAIKAGTVIAELAPVVPPQTRLDITQKLRVLDVQIAEQARTLASAQQGFQNFVATAQAALTSATEQRRTLEQIVAAHQRNFARINRLAQQGWLSYIQSDQQLIAMLADQRNLEAARSAEADAANRLADARAGRFTSDGRSTQLSPANMQANLAALQAERSALQGQEKKLAAPLPITAPCTCSVTSLLAPMGSFVSAGAEIAGLVGLDARRHQVDALVPNNRIDFLSVGERVRVYLTDRKAEVRGTIAAINHNAANTGRAGLPDTLRTLGSYGLVTVDLAPGIKPARVGVPALLEASVSIHNVLRNIPGLGWLFGNDATATQG